MALFGKKVAEQRKANKEKAEQGKALIHPLLSKLEKISHGGAIHLAALELEDGETVEYAATGELDGAGVCLLLTNTRVLICGQKGMSTSRHILDYADLNRVDTGMGLRGSWVEFFHGSETTKVEKSASGELDEIRDIVKAHRADSQQPATAPTGVGVEDLTKLAELHAAGVLTDEEFAAAKAKALGL